MNCIMCGSTLVAKRSNAKFCCSKCKWDFHRDTSATLQYRNSLRGRAVALYHNSKTRRPLGHTLTVEWIEERLKHGCAITGLPFVFEAGKQPFSPSLDKIDCTGDYTEDNVRVVVWLYNTAKNVFDDDDVLIMARALVERADGSLKSQTSRRERKGQ